MYPELDLLLEWNVVSIYICSRKKFKVVVSHSERLNINVSGISIPKERCGKYLIEIKLISINLLNMIIRQEEGIPLDRTFVT